MFVSYETLLEEIGLTKGEVTVYITLLKIGETTTGKIVEKAGISSGKIYEILDKLIKKGLASYIIRDKTKHFKAAEPERIFEYIEEREKEHEKQKEELQKALPQLKALQLEIEKKYEAQIYKGFKGMQTAAYEALRKLKPGDEVLAMGLISRKEKAYNLFWRRWHIQRIKKRIICKVIFSDRGSEHYAHFKKMKYTEVKVMEGLTPAAVDVMADKVMIFTHIEPSCLVITSQEIKQSFTQFFNTLWKIARP